MSSNTNIQQSFKFTQEDRRKIDENYLIIIKNQEKLDSSDSTIKQAIVNIAFTFEHMFKQNGQEWFISEIASIIYNDLQARGFAKSKSIYVYESLKPYPQFITSVNHKSSTSLDKPNKKLEQYYNANYTTTLELIGKVERRKAAGLYLRAQYQDLCERVRDTLQNSFVKEAEDNGIPIFNKETRDQKPKHDKISYPATNPETTVLVNAIRRNAAVINRVADTIEQEGNSNDGINKFFTTKELEQMAEAWDLQTSLWEPIPDRKFTGTHYHWWHLIGEMWAGFKNQVSSNNKITDFDGNQWALTRERIEHNADKLPKFFDQVIEFFPHYFNTMVWWYGKVRMPRKADFSRRLSPKLSNASIGGTDD